MARIRTIKPEFWTDEKIIELPYEARLLFIGIWNFCDDEGFLWDEPTRIKMQILPSEAVDPYDLVDLLIAAGFLERYTAEDGEPLLKVSKFSEHQKVSNPAKSKIGRLAYKKSAITFKVRRDVALKYKCEPGGSIEAECYYCGSKGTIHWWKKKNGEPSNWVSFSELELEHVEAEVNGGKQEGNIVLACRSCNRSKGDKNIFWFVCRNKEESREKPLEGNGMEKEVGKGNDSIPPGLHELNYAYKLIEDLQLVSTPSLISLIGSAILTASKRNGGTKSGGFEYLRKRALDARSRGQPINRFWFEDSSKWEVQGGDNANKLLDTIRTAARK